MPVHITNANGVNFILTDILIDRSEGTRRRVRAASLLTAHRFRPSLCLDSWQSRINGRGTRLCMWTCVLRLSGFGSV